MAARVLRHVQRRMLSLSVQAWICMDARVDDWTCGVHYSWLGFMDILPLTVTRDSPLPAKCPPPGLNSSVAFMRCIL